ncbi:MAG: FtsQ-type POTRA domain-containing protein [Clostridia bacterium]|nr:FtsQ-type POTRA domain-containing protein [Clostridia bacterium]MBQ8382097.1 FtsQ-type POTRA domain-containing protein [Clostridia bacterium]
MANERSEAAEFTRFQSASEKRSFIMKIVVWVFIFLFLLAVAFWFGKNLFSLKTIVVNGSEHYSYTQILNAGNIAEGDLIFSVSEDDLNQNLTQQFAYVRSVKVEKEYPGTVVITLEEETPEFYFEMQGEYFLLSRELKVLERFATSAKLLEAAPDARLVQIPEVSRAVVCETLQFAQDSKSRHTDEALDMLASSRMYDGLSEIDFSNRFDMILVYENRLEISLGSFEDFAYKLDLALGMIHAYSEKAVGTFDIIYDADGELKGIATVSDPLAE